MKCDHCDRVAVLDRAMRERRGESVEASGWLSFEEGGA